MKFGGFELRKAYYTTLTGNITYGGNVVSVYDTEAPLNSPKPFIILGSYTQTNDLNTKDGFGATATVNVEVNTEYISGVGGRKQADEIMNMILTELHPDTATINLTTDSFDVVSFELVNCFDGFSDNDFGSTYRTVAIINNKFFQK